MDFLRDYCCLFNLVLRGIIVCLFIFSVAWLFKQDNYCLVLFSLGTAWHCYLITLQLPIKFIRDMDFLCDYISPFNLDFMWHNCSHVQFRHSMAFPPHNYCLLSLGTVWHCYLITVACFT